MKYLSVCSGIEAATVAWHNLGWTPVGFSEIEPFPSAILAHHYPNVPNFGDMTKHEQWPIEPGSIDLLVGGTPCQAFSVAGLRGGLSDPRGGLMLTYLEIARCLRPKWIVWENVPGVLSSNGGRDFGSFLGALGELRYGWAYRVIDAQYCRVDGRWPKAVPQRRRRVFVVGCDLERDPGGRERAAEVLAIGTGLRWHLEESGKARKAAPTDAEAGARAGCWWDGGGCAGTLTKQNAGGAQRMPDKDNFGAVLQPAVYAWQNNDLGLKQNTITAALRSSAGTSGFHEMNHPVVVQPFTKSKRAQSVTDDETWVDGQVNPTLSLFDQGDTRATTVAVAFSDTSSTLKGGSGKRGYPDPSDGNGHSMVGTAVAHALRGEGFDASEDGTGRGTPIVPVETLQQQGYNGDHASTQEANAIATLRVLRDEIGEEAFAAWGLGVLDSLQPSQVLRARLHGEGIRCASFSRSWPIDCAISRPEDRAAWAVQSVREAEGEGCSPSGRELPQQLAEQLGAYLSQLPCPGPQAERLMHHLWCAGEGIWFLRQALSAIQDARRPPISENQSASRTMCVRRLTATECEFLQGFPRNYTLIPWRKKAAADCPDGPRYKALGNSMAVNCMAWIGARIAAVDAQMNERNET